MAKQPYPPLFIVAGLLIYICFGTIYSWSVFRGSLEELYGIGASESGLPYILFLASWALTMPIGGSFINKVGPKVAVLAGGMIISGGWIISSLAVDIFFLTITYGIIGGIGVGLAYGAPIAVSARWFPQNKGGAIGITLIGIGLSPFFTAPISTYLIGRYGVLLTFRYIGIAFFMIVSSLALILRYPQAGEVKDTQEENIAEYSAGLNVGQMLRTKEFIGLWICFVIGTLAGLTAIGIATPMGQEVVNLEPPVATMFVSLFAIFNALGRPLFGTLTDKIGPSLAVVLSCILIILGSILAVLSVNGGVLFFLASFSLLWLVLGGWLALAPAATSKLFGTKNYTQNYGFVFTAYGVGAILGGLVSGWFKDVWGSYVFVFYPILVLALVGILIALVTLRSPKVRY